MLFCLFIDDMTFYDYNFSISPALVIFLRESFNQAEYLSGYISDFCPKITISARKRNVGRYSLRKHFFFANFRFYFFFSLNVHNFVQM